MKITTTFKEFCALREAVAASDAAADTLNKMGIGHLSLHSFRRRVPAIGTVTTAGDDTQVQSQYDLVSQDTSSGEGQRQQLLNRPLYDARARARRPVAAPEPEPAKSNPIDGMSRNPWPTDADVAGHTPKKGEFGFGKRTNDFYGQATKTTSPSYRAKYNQYTPTAEEEEMILKLGQQGHQPLGITLQLGDHLGKTIPAHAVKAILDKRGGSTQP